MFRKKLSILYTNSISLVTIIYWICTMQPAYAMQTLEDSMEMRKPKVVAPSDNISGRIDRLEQNIAAMQKQLYSANSKPLARNITNAAPTANVQLDEIYQQIRSLRGEVEQLQFEFTKINEKFSKLSSDIEYRLNDLSHNNNTENKDIQKLSSVDEQLNQDHFLEGSDQAALADKKREENKENKNEKKQDKISALSDSANPEEQYQEAYSFLKERDFDRSEKLFLSFVEKNKNHQLVGNAYFWLGEIALQKNDFNGAAVRYLKGYQQNQKGTRAPDNLLKLAESLVALKKNKEACMTLIKLKKEFPNAASAIQKKAEEKSKNLACDAL